MKTSGAKLREAPNNRRRFERGQEDVHMKPAVASAKNSSCTHTVNDVEATSQEARCGSEEGATTGVRRNT